MDVHAFENPFKPGAGHKPPYLAGRTEEKQIFQHLLNQKTILENVVLTGLRGVGKTVLLEEFKQIAVSSGWYWVGNDMSEASSVEDESMAIRIITDISVVTSHFVVSRKDVRKPGFKQQHASQELKLSYDVLMQMYRQTPGLVSDKLKQVLEICWEYLSKTGRKGIVFAYDEAQNLTDHAGHRQYPLSLILDVFQSLQKKDIPFMLVLTGLPTLYPKLVDTRTYTERMFRILYLRRLNEAESRQAILKPIEASKCPVSFDEMSIQHIITFSGGYPYFIQFICREVFDAFILRIGHDTSGIVPVNEILRKLDNDFFSGRWARITDRQRTLMHIIATLPHCDQEFTVQEIVLQSRAQGGHPLSSSHTNQLLSGLIVKGLVFKSGHGRYSFAVPMLGDFIQRQQAEANQRSKYAR